VDDVYLLFLPLVRNCQAGIMRLGRAGLLGLGTQRVTYCPAGHGSHEEGHYGSDRQPVAGGAMGRPDGKGRGADFGGSSGRQSGQSQRSSQRRTQARQLLGPSLQARLPVGPGPAPQLRGPTGPRSRLVGLGAVQRGVERLRKVPLVVARGFGRHRPTS
jgi:hypothetical protein